MRERTSPAIPLVTKSSNFAETRMLGSIVSRLAAPTAECVREKCIVWGYRYLEHVCIGVVVRRRTDRWKNAAVAPQAAPCGGKANTRERSLFSTQLYTVCGGPSCMLHSCTLLSNFCITLHRNIDCARVIQQYACSIHEVLQCGRHGTFFNVQASRIGQLLDRLTCFQ